MPEKHSILLGYEVGSGRPLWVPLGHLAVTGQTQQSGKTTTLEALISRSGLRALSFLTKRGEGAFQDSRQIRPYFRERADWQYVSAILEATLREKMKFERSWIMRACKGAQTLRDVRANVERGLEKARGLNESVLTTLREYLDLVLPQIHATTFAPALDLAPGLNVMDLSAFSLELQSLLIRSALEWIYQRERGVITIIPEAWEFVPQERGSPVKLAAEELIRKGGALRNFVWLDSQDIAGVHKNILRSVRVWILGVQREANEVKRTLEHVPAPKPKVDDVMTLGLGEFFVCFGREVHRVYVQPAWLDADRARQVAAGKLDVADAVRSAGGRPFRVIPDRLPAAEPHHSEQEEEDPMWEEKCRKLESENEKLSAEIERLKKALAAPPKPPAPAGTMLHNIDEVYQYVVERLRKDPQLLRLAVAEPTLLVSVEQPTIELDHSTLRGRIAELLVEGFFDSPVNGYAVFKELSRRGMRVAKVTVNKELAMMAGLLEFGGGAA